MPDSFVTFFKSNPIWGIIIIVLMGLPLVGAVAWIVLRALKKQDNEPPR
jgi:F0F1-type ATP synthase assembly protein I